MTASLPVFVMLALTSVYCDTVFPSQKIEQFDVIILSTINTNFRDFRWNMHTNTPNLLYLTGDELFIVDITDFSVNYNNEVRLDWEYIDVSIFNSSDGSQYVLGPARNNGVVSKGYLILGLSCDCNRRLTCVFNLRETMYTVLVTLTERKSGGAVYNFSQPLLPGYSPYSIAVDARNISSPTAYMAAWVPQDSDIHFAVVRAQFQVNPNSFLQFNPDKDVCNLYLNTFTSYSPGYKPWVFHSSNNSEVVVVDPNLQQIFRIPLTDPDTFNSPGFQTISIGSRPVSVLFNRQTNKLYVGVSGQALMMKGCIHILLLFSIFYC
jgi:hypothetical protein